MWAFTLRARSCPRSGSISGTSALSGPAVAGSRNFDQPTGPVTTLLASGWSHAPVSGQAPPLGQRQPGQGERRWSGARWPRSRRHFRPPPGMLTPPGRRVFHSISVSPTFDQIEPCPLRRDSTVVWVPLVNKMRQRALGGCRWRSCVGERGPSGFPARPRCCRLVVGHGPNDQTVRRLPLSAR